MSFAPARAETKNGSAVTWQTRANLYDGYFGHGLRVPFLLVPAAAAALPLPLLLQPAAATDRSPAAAAVVPALRNKRRLDSSLLISCWLSDLPSFAISDPSRFPVYGINIIVIARNCHLSLGCARFHQEPPPAPIHHAPQKPSTGNVTLDLS